MQPDDAAIPPMPREPVTAEPRESVSANSQQGSDQPGPETIRSLLSRLESRLGPRAYAHWIAGKVGLSLEGDHLLVEVGSPFLLAWMQRQFGATFRTVTAEVLGPGTRVRFMVDGNLGRAADGKPAATADPASLSKTAPTTRPSAEPLTTTVPFPATVPLAAATMPMRRRLPVHLADLVRGNCNDLAIRAVERFIRQPAGFPGPLYVYGGVGLGKTHLLESIATALRGTTGVQVVSLSAEIFANYFTESIRNRTQPAFRARFRGVGVLVVDDLDFFDGKQGLQTEFLQTVQQLERLGCAIAVAADRHPKLLTKTCDELTSRFLAGTVCRLDLPDFETRLQIVRSRAAKLPASPPPSTLEYVARRFRSSVRELEGALNCLDVYREAAGKPASVSAAQRLLADMERDCLKTVRLGDIEQAVCEFFGVAPDEVRSANRSRQATQPRMVAMYLARKLTGAAYSAIGGHFGGRNHSTVMAAERKMKKLLEDRSPHLPGMESCTLSEAIRSIEARLSAG